MLQDDLFVERSIFLPAQQPHQVGEKSLFLELFAHDQFALIDIAVDRLFAQRLEHHVPGGRRNEAQNFGGLHHFKEVAELEVQVASNAVAVVAAAAILERLEQAENPAHLAIGDRIDAGRSHQARSSINEKTLSVSALKPSWRRLRGRGNSTFRSATSRPGPVQSTRIRSASSTASSIIWVTRMMLWTG